MAQHLTDTALHADFPSPRATARRGRANRSTYPYREFDEHKLNADNALCVVVKWPKIVGKIKNLFSAIGYEGERVREVLTAFELLARVFFPFGAYRREGGVAVGRDADMCDVEPVGRR
mgnify:CR=1 FL=1